MSFYCFVVFRTLKMLVKDVYEEIVPSRSDLKCFEELMIDPRICEKLKRQNKIAPTPIQAKSIPLLMYGTGRRLNSDHYGIICKFSCRRHCSSRSANGKNAYPRNSCCQSALQVAQSASHAARARCSTYKRNCAAGSGDDRKAAAGWFHISVSGDLQTKHRQ